LWQVVQLALVLTWLEPLPVALLPLWQLVQVVAELKVRWSALAPSHLLVELWQLSQLAVVDRWLLFLSLAILPLWQLEHPVLTLTLAWNLAGVQLV
jgi:hypothetical protein